MRIIIHGSLNILRLAMNVKKDIDCDYDDCQVLMCMGREITGFVNIP